MTILINDKPHELDEPCSVAILLERHGARAGSVAVAHNEQFVSRANYATTIMQDGDTLEIVAPMQGG
ncbi:MAG TPA: thiamine biosynthesis protein ThiS [Lentisphaeria bacterium]|jgi:sulfur carrier protein|nr:thiamine biosynthesis protein ThiS [Lentisphaeria bacterium]